MRSLALVLLLTAAGCTGRGDWVARAYPGDFPTSHGPLRRTALGIPVSGDGDPDVVDFVARTVYECLQREVPEGKLTAEEDSLGYCYEGAELAYPHYRELIVVVESWELSCDKRQQLLLVDAPDSGCRAKGREPTPECPCRWRSGFREGENWLGMGNGELLFVVTPSLYMLSDAFVRYITGCRNPWVVERIRKCASPKVPMLPDG